MQNLTQIDPCVWSVGGDAIDLAPAHLILRAHLYYRRLFALLKIQNVRHVWVLTAYTSPITPILVGGRKRPSASILPFRLASFTVEL